MTPRHLLVVCDPPLSLITAAHSPAVGQFWHVYASQVKILNLDLACRTSSLQLTKVFPSLSRAAKPCTAGCEAVNQLGQDEPASG